MLETPVCCRVAALVINAAVLHGEEAERAGFRSYYCLDNPQKLVLLLRLNSSKVLHLLPRRRAMVMPKDTESSKQKKEEKSPKTLVERTGIELTEDQLNSKRPRVLRDGSHPNHPAT